MGTFQGHFLNGLSFVIISIWWTVNVWRYHFRSLCNDGEPFSARFAFPGPCTRKFPMESVFKIVATLLCILFEMISAFDSHGNFVHWGNAQHSTMAFFFTLTGVVDILRNYWPNIMPEACDSTMGVFAFAVEALTFGNHKDGKPPAELQAHGFLLYAIFATIGCIYLEARGTCGAVASMGRTYFTLLQGTWLMQIGFMFFPPFDSLRPWSPNNEREMAVAVVAFCLHAIADLLFMAGIGALVFAAMKRRGALDNFQRDRIADSHEQVKLMPLAVGASDDELA